MPLLVLGLNHRTAPVSLRERFAFADARIPAVLQSLKQNGLAEEAVIFSTCNRVELYVSTSLEPRAAFIELQNFLVRIHEYREPLAEELYRLDEPHSVEHLFRVAAGLDSMVLGETEVLGQLKKAYDTALQQQHTGRELNRVFQRAFNVAKQIRSETNIQRGATSVAAVAVELAEKIFTSLRSRHVMVIGAGDTSEKAARALLSRGAKSILVSNRSYERAESLARELGGRAIHFDNWAEEFTHIDIVISSTSAPHYVLDSKKLLPLMRRRSNAPLLLIDIAVPRDIDPEVNYLENVYLYNVDDLQAIADNSLRQRREELNKCEAIVRQKASAFLGSRRLPPSPPGSQPIYGHE
jgi:glutamyl-tRNA reductase